MVEMIGWRSDGGKKNFDSGFQEVTVELINGRGGSSKEVKKITPSGGVFDWGGRWREQKYWLVLGKGTSRLF